MTVIRPIKIPKIILPFKVVGLDTGSVMMKNAARKVAPFNK